MVASGRVEELEALYNHIEYLNSKLDIFDSITGTNSAIFKELHSSQGEKVKKAIDQFFSSKEAPGKRPQTLNLSSHQNFFTKLSTQKFYTFVQSIKYMYQFCLLSRHELKNLCEKVKDFDLRWNQYFTIRCCQVFVQYCKTILFIKAHQIIKYIIVIASHSPKDFQINEKVCDTNFLNKIKDFVLSCSNDPFQFIHNEVEFLSSPLARLTGTVGAFIGRLFGTFPLIDFNQFSIFNPSNSQPETTLMDDESIILSHLNLMKETLFFFLFAFYEKSESNDCFELVIESLLTESPKVTLSKVFMVPIQEFMKFSQNSYIPNRLLSITEETSVQKFSSHKQRMMHVTFLLQDIIGIVKYKKNMLPHLQNKIMAISGLAFYELDQYFMFNDIRCPEAIELLSVTVEMADIIRKNQEDIQRFYIYNLSTIDNQFLKKQLSEECFSNLSPKQNEYEIIALLNSLSNALDTINIVDYDKGIRYDFIAFEVTYERYLRIFNDAKCRIRLSYLEPIFEHLTTIRNHMELARNALETFLYYCQIHSLWRHTIPIVSASIEGNIFNGTINDNTWTRHVNDPNIPIDHSACLLQIFTFFSYDFKCLRKMPDVVSNMMIVYSIIRQKLFEKIKGIISNQISPSSQNVRVGLQTHDYSRVKKFNTSEFTAFTSHKFSKSMKEEQSKLVSLTNQVKLFSKSIPKSVILFNFPSDPAAKFFATTLIQTLSNTLFPSKIPDPSLMDRSFTAATEYLWPIWSILSCPFPFQMFLCRYLNSFPLETSTKLTEQLKSFTGEIPYVPKPKEKMDVSNHQKSNQLQQQLQQQQLGKVQFDISNSFVSLKKSELINGIEHKFDSFIDHKWENMIYLKSLKGFWKKNSLIIPKPITSTTQFLQYQNEQQNQENQDQQQNTKNFYSIGDFTKRSSFYTKESFYYIVKNLGLHSALRIDRIFIYKIASLMHEIFHTFVAAFAKNDLKNWFKDFTLCGSMPSEDSVRRALSQFDFNGLCKKFVLLGSCIVMRQNLLEVIKNVVQSSLPGIQEILLSTISNLKSEKEIDNNNFLNPLQALVSEAILGSDSPGSNVFFYKFFDANSGSMKVVAYPDIGHFFFFLALVLTNRYWDNCTYLHGFDSITENLHLFPFAINQFIQLHSVFFSHQNGSMKEVKDKALIFISALAQVVEMKQAKKLINISTSLTILADMIPKIIGIEYERIEKVFPNRKINFAYSPVLTKLI